MTIKKTAARKRPAAKPAATTASAKPGPARAKKKTEDAKPSPAKARRAAPVKTAPKPVATPAKPAAAAKSKPKASVARTLDAAPAKKPARAKPSAEAQSFDPDRRRELIAAAAARRRKGVTAKTAPLPISIIKPREASPVERHRFSVGEEVRVVSTSGMWFKHGIEFKVTAALPPQGGKLQYRIKNELEPFERVVSESQLAAAAGAQA